MVLSTTNGILASSVMFDILGIFKTSRLGFDNDSAKNSRKRQPKAISIQELLEEALGKLLSKNISIVGAGRTDTGVHALQMFAHFDVEQDINKPMELVFLLNSFLKNDITIKNICLLYTSPSPRDLSTSRMPSSA